MDVTSDGQQPIRKPPRPEQEIHGAPVAKTREPRPLGTLGYPKTTLRVCHSSRHGQRHGKISSLFTKSLGGIRHTQYAVMDGRHKEENRSERGAETHALYNQPASGKHPHSADQQRQRQPDVYPKPAGLGKGGVETSRPLRPSPSGGGSGAESPSPQRTRRTRPTRRKSSRRSISGEIQRP